ncbi:DNA-binding IclR family transcriptional regulator OS=Castellaniella defragrans OX=75697 GN=HNR28_001216 PE=4 SV=1 [Castellaniella defragrans]
MPEQTSLPAQTVGRAALLLRIIASSQSRHLRLLDIAAMAALDKSTAQRLLHRLVIERLLVRDPARGYRLGPLLYELGLSALPETNLSEVGRAPLHALAQSTGDMVFLILRSGFETVCLGRIAGSFPIQTMTRTEGDRHPLGVGAGGGAVLAAMHDSDIELALPAIAPRLPAYHLTERGVLAAVQATRDRGDIAIDEGSAAFDVTAIGRAIHDASHAPVAAVFVASIQHRMGASRQKEIIKQLITCVDAIEALWAR